MIRLGFGTRLLLIVATALVALQILVVAVYFLQRSRDTETGFRLPLPDQAAALVELLDAIPKDRWPLVLRAANSTDLRVRLEDGPPAGAEASWYEAPVVELIMKRYLAKLGDRPISVTVEPSSELLEGPMRMFAWASRGSVNISVGLKSGETLVITTGGVLSLSMLGVPPGFWAGILAARPVRCATSPRRSIGCSCRRRPSRSPMRRAARLRFAPSSPPSTAWSSASPG